MVLKGKLGMAPVENPQSVLDIGTGTGIWAIEYGMSGSFHCSPHDITCSQYYAATQHPSAEVLGTDLSPIQPD
jgi:methylase of polypeptide subunit release factors